MPYIFTGKYVPPYLRNNPIVPKRKVIAVSEQNKQIYGRDRAVERMRVNKLDYEKRSGKVTNHKVISEYSVTIDREVLNNRSNARYLVEDNIRNGVNFDLVEGVDSFINKILSKEPCLHPLCKWAIAQPGSTIKEVFHGAEFACHKGTLKKMAMTLLHRKDEWTVVAQKFNGVILISDNSKRYFGSLHNLSAYSDCSFKQYMTAKEPDGRPDTTSSVDNRASFEMMVRTDLMDGENVIKLCCGGEIGALRGGSKGFEPIAFQTVFYGLSRVNRDVPTVMQNEIMGVKTLVIGIKRGTHKDQDVVVNEVVEKRVSDVISENNISSDLEQVY